MDRYSWMARWYDLIAAEPVYRAGRRIAIAALGARPGDRIIDLGCGTGLNLPRLCAAVGSGGAVVGVDESEQMLLMAARKARRAGWRQTSFVHADATQLGPGDIAGRESMSLQRFDALLATYALSLMPDPGAAWRAARAMLAPDARVAVVDLALPGGRARWAAPLARLACALGGSDIEARPWEIVERDLVGVQRWELLGGHVQVRVGSCPGTR